jgi:hypothetical protein
MVLECTCQNWCGVSLFCLESSRYQITSRPFPVVVDACIGAPSHAAEPSKRMPMRCSSNTAICAARDSIRMATAFKNRRRRCARGFRSRSCLAARSRGGNSSACGVLKGVVRLRRVSSPFHFSMFEIVDVLLRKFGFAASDAVLQMSQCFLDQSAQILERFDK